MEILNEQSSNKTSFWCVCSLVFCRLSLHSTVRANKSNDLNPKGALALKHRWQHENNVHKKCGSLVVAAVFVCVLTIRFLSEREISNEAWEKPTVNLSRALLFQIVFTYNRNAQNPFVIFEKAFHFGMIMRPQLWHTDIENDGSTKNTEFGWLFWCPCLLFVSPNTSFYALYFDRMFSWDSNSWHHSIYYITQTPSKNFRYCWVARADIC